MEINLFFKQIPLSAFAAPAPLSAEPQAVNLYHLSQTQFSTFLQQHSLFCTNKSTYVQHLSWQGDTGCIYKLTITNIRITENLIWARLYCTCPLLFNGWSVSREVRPQPFFLVEPSLTKSVLYLISISSWNSYSNESSSNHAHLRVRTSQCQLKPIAESERPRVTHNLIWANTNSQAYTTDETIKIK